MEVQPEEVRWAMDPAKPKEQNTPYRVCMIQSSLYRLECRLAPSTANADFIARGNAIPTNRVAST